nr:hypothetical protein [Amylibacter sp.]
MENFRQHGCWNSPSNAFALFPSRAKRIGQRGKGIDLRVKPAAGGSIPGFCGNFISGTFDPFPVAQDKTPHFDYVQYRNNQKLTNLFHQRVSVNVFKGKHVILQVFSMAVQSG